MIRRLRILIWGIQILFGWGIMLLGCRDIRGGRGTPEGAENEFWLGLLITILCVVVLWITGGKKED